VQALPLVQGLYCLVVCVSEIHFFTVFYFRQVPLLSDARITDILEVSELLFICFRYVIETHQMLCKCLDDEVVEVREMAAT
jgi:proteasome activator subunit 4